MVPISDAKTFLCRPISFCHLLNLKTTALSEVNCKAKFWGILWLEYILACLNCYYFIDTSSASFTNCNDETLSAWWGWCFEVRCFKNIWGLSSLLQWCQTSRIANDGFQALKSRCRCMAIQILNVSKEMS